MTLTSPSIRIVFMMFMIVSCYLILWGRSLSLIEQANLLASTITNNDINQEDHALIRPPPIISLHENESQLQEQRDHLHQILSTAHTRQQIPPLLILTHETNLLDPQSANRTLARHFGDNLLHSIQVYHQQFLPSLQAQPLPVWFLNDTECHTVLSHVPQPWGTVLAEWFLHPTPTNMPSKGRFRSDLCRIAALYHTGGLYLDVDLQTLSPVHILSPNTHFATAVMMESAAYAGLFFQAVLATKARHPILTHNFEKLQAFWKIHHEQQQQQPSHDQQQKHHEEWLENLLDNHGGLLGPTTLQAAFRQYMDDRGGEDEAEEAVLLWPEELLNTPEKQQAKSFVPPALSYQKGYGCCCNYVVHNGTHPLFFSRFVDANDYCRSSKSSTPPEQEDHSIGDETTTTTSSTLKKHVLPWDDPRSNGKMYWLVDWERDIYPWIMKQTTTT